MKKLILKTGQLLLLAALLLALFIALAMGVVAGWEYTNTSRFCATTCHGVHPEEPEAYQDSYHARVKCVECHLGRTPLAHAVWLKASHSTRVWHMVTGHYERPLVAVSMRPANESCERCHWPPAFHDDSLRVLKHYEEDQASTEVRTYLTLHTGGGTAREGRGKGIHWHIENEVRFIATDEQMQDIPWVEVNYLDGRRTTYMDAAHPLTPEQVAEAPKRVMDCVGCHNRVGHPFEGPEEAVDRAIALGRIDRSLPFVKAYALEVLEGDHAPEAEGADGARAFSEGYAREHPEAAAAHAEAVRQAETVLSELVRRIRFREPGISWRSFPDGSGHKNFAGCFRCHDGKHVSSDGESIRLHCNLCHDIPSVVREGAAPPAIQPLAIPQPASHLDTNFMRDHRLQVGRTCTVCHGEIRFGRDGKSFCSNPACHGIKWPYVDLDATTRDVQ